MAVPAIPAPLRAWRGKVLDGHLANARGILHLGAHLGREAAHYARHGKQVVWVEALPAIHRRLATRLEATPDQRALCALLGDTDDEPRLFHVSNNFEGESSSLFEFGPFGRGADSLWPALDLQMVDRLVLRSVRLDSLLRTEGIDGADVDFWVLDLQGAELLALKGAPITLKSCRALLIETSSVPVYDGGVLWDELSGWLMVRGFVPMWQPACPHDDVLFVADHEIDRARSTFDTDHYRRHDRARLDHLASLGLTLSGHRVLEVGAGAGAHTAFYRDQDCRVTATDARPANLHILKRRFADDPGVEVAMLDLDDPQVDDPSVGGSYETVHCYGLLYHLRDPAAALRLLAARCDDQLLLETCVSGDDDRALNRVDEPAGHYDQSFHGTGCRPGRAWVWRTLQTLFPFVYMTRTQPDHPEFPLDWDPGAAGDPGLKRAVFVGARRDLSANPLLSDVLVERHVGRPSGP